jgi:hypothetical protein
MENVVGYFDQQSGASHDHGDGGQVVEYRVDRDDPYHPCNDVGASYKTTCWLMQTSLILYFNGGDFEDAARICADDEKAEGHSGTCFQSLGRDAASYSGRDAEEAAQWCAYGAAYASSAAETYEETCIRGFVAEGILNYASAEHGLATCTELPEHLWAACYREVGQQGNYMLASHELEALCARAASGYEDECRDGGGLPAE